MEAQLQSLTPTHGHRSALIGDFLAGQGVRKHPQADIYGHLIGRPTAASQERRGKFERVRIRPWSLLHARVHPRRHDGDIVRTPALVG